MSTYENRNVLEAVPGAAIIGERLSILENKGNLNDTCKTSSHQGVTKHGVRHGADHQLLRVRRHAPTSDEDNESRDEVALRVTIAISAQPNTGQTRTPPDYAHCSVLPIILDPGGTPAVLRESVDAAPSGNDGAVVELLRSSRTTNPNLSREQNNGQKDTIGNECASHDKVGCALTNVIALAEAKGGDTSKDHLHPCEKRHRFANDRVEWSDKLANHAEGALLPVKLQV